MAAYELVDCINVVALLDEVERAWPNLTICPNRKLNLHQAEVDSVKLRDVVAEPGAHRWFGDFHGRGVADTANAALVPSLMEWLRAFAERQNGTLERALIACLPPGCRVGRHVDAGSYYILRDRYHLVLRAARTIFEADGTHYEQNEGDLWRHDNTAPHGAHNPSEQDRLIVLFDLLPRDRKMADDELLTRYFAPEHRLDHPARAWWHGPDREAPWRRGPRRYD
jgi:hypothetical protein